MKLKPRKFKLKNSDTDCCSYGLIAQEVADECKTNHQKNIVNHYDKYEENKDCDEILGVSYQSFIPLLIKVVQNQQKEIEDARLAEERAKAKEELRARVIADPDMHD